MKNIKLVFIFVVVTYSLSSIYAEDFVLESPNKNLKVTIQLENPIFWSVEFNEQKLMEKSPISMKSSLGTIPNDDSKLIKKVINSVNEKIETVVRQKSKFVKNFYNELRLDFDENYSIIFRAYNNGCAYRFETDFDNDMIVYNEDVSLNFVDNYKSYFPGVEEDLISHYEAAYEYINLGSIDEDRIGLLPFLVDTENGIKIAFTESGVYNYPNMFLQRTYDNSFSGIFPNVVLQVEDVRDREESVISEADYIAKVKGSRNFPWRILMISEEDKDLIENQMVFLLSDSLKLKDTEWINPGKVAWDWWNANNVFEVDFESGINTDTYKYYIDFASEFNLDYIILDEGWSKSTTDLLEPSENIDLTELVSYGKEKNVGLILWVLWKPLNKDMGKILDKYAEWGIKGIKVDFMQRADQWIVKYYERVLYEAAKRKLVVDFHGAFKPCGLNRPYPNYLTSEGVMGLENSKWSKNVTPEHDLILPFTRMLAGPMDYTPGAMVNTQPKNFYSCYERPMSQGTRAHQAGMYVVYESPLQMLADSPSKYLQDRTYTKFISKFPAVWDTTIVLEASVSDYVLIAREKDNVWYIGGMNDETERDISIDFSFLEEGSYRAEILQDGINANKFAQDYKLITTNISPKDKQNIHFAPGGGWAAIITKQ